MRGEVGNKERLGHILDAISNIESALKGKTKENFLDDNVLKAAVNLWIQIIGEASSRLTKEFRTENNQVEWVNIIGLRNIIVHEYFGVSFETIWEVIAVDIPLLKERVERMYGSFHKLD